MKTNLTQSQLDQLAELITFYENEDGVLFIKDVLGNVEGDVVGTVKGSVLGNVFGNVHGQIAEKYWTSLEYRDDRNER